MRAFTMAWTLLAAAGFVFGGGCGDDDSTTDVPDDSSEVDVPDDGDDHAGDDVSDDGDGGTEVDVPDGVVDDVHDDGDGGAEVDVPDDVSDDGDSGADVEADVRPDTGIDVPVVGGDVVRPRVTVVQGATQLDPTSTLPIRFDITFDEPIDAATFEASDFEIEPDLPCTRTLVPAGDGMRFELRLSGLASVDETYEASLPDSRVDDLAGNPNEPSTGADHRVRYDVTQPTIEIRQYIPVLAVTNTLPITFQVVFQVAVTPSTFTLDDVTNGGTAGPVTWTIESASPGYLYFVRATAAGSTGTVYPVIPAGAATAALTGASTLESVFFGTPPVYTPLPILGVTDASGDEGGTIYVRAQFQGTTSATATTFDWSTVDGTAHAGVDYVAAGGTDVTIAAGLFNAALSVSATPEDDVPEPHKQLTVVIRNVRGGVYVHDDTGIATITNDDTGYASYGANDGSNPDARATDIRLSTDDVHVFGESYDYDPTIQRRDLASGGIEEHLGVGDGDPGGMAANGDGYYFATNLTGAGYTLRKYDHATDRPDSAFGTYGEIEVTDATDALWAVDLAADETRLYVVGTRTDPGGDSQWLVEARDGTTGALVPTFGTAGTLLLDRATGLEEEAPLTVETDGTSLFVLGRIGDAGRVEKRLAATGTLDAAFAAAGVLELTWVARAIDLAVHAGRLYVLGLSPAGDSSVVRLQSGDGTPEWIGFSIMDVPGCVSVDDSGVYIGGARSWEMHLERWALEGTPLWARTYGLELSPTALTDIALEPGARWVHVAGYHTRGGHRDWYYDRRYIPDGFYYIYSPGEPLE